MSLCPICRSLERVFFSRRVLGKYDVTYYFCNSCKFLHTEKPYWLSEAYADAIVAADTGIAVRNLDASAKAAALFRWMFGGKGKYIDLAGGYGLFTRLMRDMGFDYYWSDQYAENYFARGFEGSVDASETYSGATAFEVLEHVESPVEFIQDAFRKTRCEVLFFSTELYQGEEPPASWWYYGLSAGQHISFFHRKTLETIAGILDVQLNSNRSFHALSRIPINKATYALLTSRLSARILPVFARNVFGSKVMEDHYVLINK